MLKGKKSYLVAAVAVVYAVSALLYGAIDAETAMQIVINGLGLATLRNAIK